MAEGLMINPDALPIDTLRELPWQVVEPQYQARLATLAAVRRGAVQGAWQ